MGGKNKRQKKVPFQHIAHVNDDYSLTISLSKMKKYGNRDYGVTDSENKIESDHSYSMSNSQAVQSPYTSDNINRADYYNLDNKIMSLTDNNNQAHDNLRKELESKIKTVEDNAITNSAKDRKSTIRWLIGIAVTVIVAVGSFFMIPYRIARNNEKDITIIKTTIEKSLAPSIEKNSNAIETINVEIKEYLNNNSNKKTNTQKKSTSCPSTK